MNTAALGDIAEIVSGATPKTGVPEFWDGEVEWATPADLSKLDGPFISTTPRKITQAGVRSCATTVLPAGSVLLSSRAPIGHVAINTVPMATNQGFKSLVPHSMVDAKYLYYWLKSKTLYLQSLGNGATFKELSKKTTQQIEVPLPPLPEQRRIAAILDHADALRAKRRQVLAHLDSLTQSIFHDMFGRSDQSGQALGDVATFFGGASLKNGSPFSDQSHGTLLMRVSDMNSSGNEERIMSTSMWTGEPTPRSSTAPEGAVVLPKRGASIATNKKRVTVRPTALDPNLMGIAPDPHYLTTTYLYAWFKSFDLTSITSGSTVPQLNKQDLAPLRIPVPALMDQRRFDAYIKGVEARVSIARAALEVDDELFASLQSRAFAGEL